MRISVNLYITLSAIAFPLLFLLLNWHCSVGYYRYHYEEKRTHTPGKHCFYKYDALYELVAERKTVDNVSGFASLLYSVLYT